MMDEFRSYVLREISEIRDLVVRFKSMSQSGDNDTVKGFDVQHPSLTNNNSNGRRVLMIF